MNHLIIDGFNLAYRSHYAFINLETPAGLLSGAVYGFLVGARTIKTKYMDCHVTIAWDTESQRRKQIDASYKANRNKFELPEQIKDLKGIFNCLNVSQAEYFGEEADDVIATLTKQYSAEGGKVFILTSDKDMLQLVRDGQVHVIRPKKGAVPERVFDEEAVKEEFGVAPKDLECLLSFKGDSVDNIPGVPRVKTACLVDLIQKYKTPQNIYDHLAEEKLTDFQRKSLSDSQARVMMNIDLVRLRDDLNVNIYDGSANEEVLGVYLNKYAIKSINPNSYVNSFMDVSCFQSRTAPAIQSYSIFD